MQMYIVKTGVDKLGLLKQLSRLTFSETFSPYNSATDMELYLNHAFSTAQLRKELNENSSAFYIAYCDTEPAGYLKVNIGASQTDLHAANALEIERIYVLKKFQGRKVGQLLFDKALEISGKIKAEFVWLGVWEKNEKAIRFYEKNGFVTFGRHPFILGKDVQTDLLMKKICGA